MLSRQLFTSSQVAQAGLSMAQVPNSPGWSATYRSHSFLSWANASGSFVAWVNVVHPKRQAITGTHHRRLLRLNIAASYFASPGSVIAFFAS